jgi:sensor histidine kinase YesM
LLIQPLVENAIKHGISPLKRGGTVSITATIEPADGRRQTGGLLRVMVTDTGTGLDRLTLAEGGEGEGVGLRSIDQRLAIHYGTDAALEVTSAAGAGTRAELRIPVTSDALAAVSRPELTPAPGRATGATGARTTVQGT